MTKHLCAVGGGHGIRVNAIVPGMIYTPETAPFLDDPDGPRRGGPRPVRRRPALAPALARCRASRTPDAPGIALNLPRPVPGAGYFPA